MTVTQQQLDQFYAFATQQVANGQDALSWNELLDKWRAEIARADDELQASVAAVERGLEDIRAGRSKPLDEFLDELQSGDPVAAEA